MTRVARIKLCLYLLQTASTFRKNPLSLKDSVHKSTTDCNTEQVFCRILWCTNSIVQFLSVGNVIIPNLSFVPSRGMSRKLLTTKCFGSLCNINAIAIGISKCSRYAAW